MRTTTNRRKKHTNPVYITKVRGFSLKMASTLPNSTLFPFFSSCHFSNACDICNEVHKCARGGILFVVWLIWVRGCKLLPPSHFYSGCAFIIFVRLIFKAILSEQWSCHFIFDFHIQTERVFQGGLMLANS